MLEAAERVQKNPERLRMPCLVLIGTEDPVIDPTESVAFVERLGSKDRRLWKNEGGVHDPLHDQGWEHAVERIGAWIERQLVGVTGQTW